jgi:hypothetical protein
VECWEWGFVLSFMQRCALVCGPGLPILPLMDDLIEYYTSLGWLLSSMMRARGITRYPNGAAQGVLDPFAACIMASCCKESIRGTMAGKTLPNIVFRLHIRTIYIHVCK